MATRTQTEGEQIVSRNLRAAGQCGAMGFPTYDDGRRWRTFCLLPAAHPDTTPHTGPNIAGHGVWSDD